MKKEKAIIVDIDNTLGFDKIQTPIPNSPIREVWDKFHEEHEFYNPNNFKKFDDVIEIVNSFYYSHNAKVIFMTARENTSNGKIFHNTYVLLMELFSFAHPRFYNIDYTILMREENDFRKDEDVKRDLYNKFVKDNFKCIVAIDDKIENINMFREVGIPMLLHINRGVEYEK